MWGDPRLWGQHVKIEDLYVWTAHLSVSKAACYEALHTIEAKGWATTDFSGYMCPFDGRFTTLARYRMTQDGLEALRMIEIGQHPGRIPLAPPPEIAASLALFEADHPVARSTAFIMMEFGETPAHNSIVSSVKATLKKHTIEGVSPS